MALRDKSNLQLDRIQPAKNTDHDPTYPDSLKSSLINAKPTTSSDLRSNNPLNATKLIPSNSAKTNRQYQQQMPLPSPSTYPQHFSVFRDDVNPFVPSITSLSKNVYGRPRRVGISPATSKTAIASTTAIDEALPLPQPSTPPPKKTKKVALLTTKHQPPSKIRLKRSLSADNASVTSTVTATATTTQTATILRHQRSSTTSPSPPRFRPTKLSTFKPYADTKKSSNTHQEVSQATEGRHRPDRESEFLETANAATELKTMAPNTSCATITTTTTTAAEGEHKNLRGTRNDENRGGGGNDNNRDGAVIGRQDNVSRSSFALRRQQILPLQQKYPSLAQEPLDSSLKNTKSANRAAVYRRNDSYDLATRAKNANTVVMLPVSFNGIVTRKNRVSARPELSPVEENSGCDYVNDNDENDDHGSDGLSGVGHGGKAAKLVVEGEMKNFAIGTTASQKADFKNFGRILNHKKICNDFGHSEDNASNIGLHLDGVHGQEVLEEALFDIEETVEDQQPQLPRSSSLVHNSIDYSHQEYDYADFFAGNRRFPEIIGLGIETYANTASLSKIPAPSSIPPTNQQQQQQQQKKLSPIEKYANSITNRSKIDGDSNQEIIKDLSPIFLRRISSAKIQPPSTPSPPPISLPFVSSVQPLRTSYASSLLMLFQAADASLSKGKEDAKLEEENSGDAVRINYGDIKGGNFSKNGGFGDDNDDNNENDEMSDTRNEPIIEAAVNPILLSAFEGIVKTKNLPSNTKQKELKRPNLKTHLPSTTIADTANLSPTATSTYTTVATATATAANSSALVAAEDARIAKNNGKKRQGLINSTTSGKKITSSNQNNADEDGNCENSNSHEQQWRRKIRKTASTAAAMTVNFNIHASKNSSVNNHNEESMNYDDFGCVSSSNGESRDVFCEVDANSSSGTGTEEFYESGGSSDKNDNENDVVVVEDLGVSFERGDSKGIGKETSDDVLMETAKTVKAAVANVSRGGVRKRGRGRGRKTKMGSTVTALRPRPVLKLNRKDIKWWAYSESILPETGEDGLLF